MSLTPICDFLAAYRSQGIARLHMPGHKGRSAMQGSLWEELPFSLDLTEIKGADALFEATGIIGESERIAASLYDADCTCFSAGAPLYPSLPWSPPPKHGVGSSLPFGTPTLP